MLLNDISEAPRELMKTLEIKLKDYADLTLWNNELKANLLLNYERITITPYLRNTLKNAKLKKIGLIEIEDKLSFNLLLYHTKYQSTFSAIIPPSHEDKYRMYSNHERDRLLIKGIYAYLKYTLPETTCKVIRDRDATYGRYYTLQVVAKEKIRQAR